MTQQLIPLSKISDNHWQPRSTMDPARMEDLIASMDQVGVLHAPVVRFLDGWWELASGHRRVEGVRICVTRGIAKGRAWEEVQGEAFMWADVQELSDEEMRVIALLENTKREDLTQMEAHRAYQRYLDEVPGATITGLAERVGVDRTTLSHGLRVLRLPAAVLELIEGGTMAFGVGREWVPLSCPAHGFHDALVQELLDWCATRADSYSAIEAFDVDGSPHVSGGTYTREFVRRGLGHIAADALYHMEGPLRLCESKEDVQTRGAASFDVDSFCKEHEDELHTLPSTYEPGKSYRFTCATEAWDQAQRAVVKEAKDNKGPALRKQWRGMVGESTQLAELRQANKAAKLAGPPTAAELRDLGPLGEEPVKKDKVEWARSMWARADHFDRSECGGCTKGARYLMKYGQLELHCTNKDCWNEKDQQGLAVAKEKAKDHQAAEVAQCARIRALMQESPHWPVVLAKTCVRLTEASIYDFVADHGDRTPEGLPYQSTPRVALLALLPSRATKGKEGSMLKEVMASCGSAEEAEEALFALTMRTWQRRDGLPALEKALKKGVAQGTRRG